MMRVEEAIERLLQASHLRVEAERTGLGNAVGRVLADDLVSPLDVPPADNSAMDGYAFRHADWPGPDGALPLSQRITAGSVPGALDAVSAARIFTGAETPPGADTVVMQEHCEETAQGVRILQRPAPGANIRRRGQDVRQSQVVLRRGHRLRPQDVGLSASLGLAELPVYRRLKVATIATGDELAEPGEKARPGQIYNSNRYLMHAQLSAWGFEVVDLGVARDTFDAVESVMREAAASADFIVTSGGVSVGEEDHVKDVVARLGALDLWKIAVKPGKPFAFGHVKGTPFIGLPGNPVSVFVTLLVIARGCLFASQGATDTRVRAVAGRAAVSRRETSREEYNRVRSTGSGLELYYNQSSGALFSICWSDGLVRQPSGTAIEEGDTVEYLPFQAFL